MKYAGTEMTARLNQSLGNVEVCLDPLGPVPDPRSGKLREVIAAVHP